MVTRGSEPRSRSEQSPPHRPGTDSAGPVVQGATAPKQIQSASVARPPLSAPENRPATAAPSSDAAQREQGAQRATAERFLRAVIVPGTWCEIRSPKCPERLGGKYRRVASAYHDDPVAAAADAMKIDALGPAGVYVTINPVDPAINARAHRKINHKAESTTGDAEILRRRWLPVDVDAGQPSGVSATDEEREAAIAVSRRIHAELTAAGWPAPLYCSTPNGAHLFYRLDLPNDLDALDLVTRVLAGLGDRFDAGKAHVDRGIFNAARIMRIAGTMGRKGDSTPERPHRRGDLLDVPDKLEVVTLAQLEAVAAWAPAAPERKNTPKVAAPIAPAGENSIQRQFRLEAEKDAAQAEWDKFDRIGQPTTPASVRDYLERHNVTVKKTRAKDDKHYLDIDCPITDAAGGTSVTVIVDSSGVISFANRHNRGDGLKWADLREHLEPGSKAAQERCAVAWAALEANKGPTTKTTAGAGQRAASATSTGDDQSETVEVPRLKVKRAADLMLLVFAALKWIIPGILCEGYAVLAGRPKLGKSYLALDFCIAVAAGLHALGALLCERRRVLYCGLEDGERRLQKRMREVAGEKPIPELLDYLSANELPRFNKGGLEALDAYLTEHPDTGLVVIDTYAKVRPPKPNNADPYQWDYDNGAALADLARKHRVCILAVLHARKAPSEDFIDEITGTLGIAGAADVIMVMRRARGSQDVALHITGKDVPEQGLSLRCDWNTKAWTIAGDLEAVQHTREVREILDAMPAGKEVTPAQIADVIGLKPDIVRHRLREMLKKGVEGFEQGGYGKYVKKHSFSSFSHFSHSAHSEHSSEGKNEQNERMYRDTEEGVL